MGFKYVFDNHKTVAFPQAMAASTTVNTDYLDMTGALSVGFILIVGAGDKTVDFKLQRDDNTAFTSPTDIPTAAIAQIGTGATNQLAVIQVLRPTERYVRGVIVTGSGGATSRQVTVLAYQTDRFGTTIATSSYSQVITVQEGT